MSTDRPDADFHEEVELHFRLPSRIWLHTLTCKECGAEWEIDFEEGTNTEGEHDADCRVGLMTKKVEGCRTQFS